MLKDEKTVVEADDARYSQAAGLLEALDRTWDPRCAFQPTEKRGAPSGASLLHPEHEDTCRTKGSKNMSAIEAVRSLQNTIWDAWGTRGWDGMAHGCPHVAEAGQFKSTSPSDSCLTQLAPPRPPAPIDAEARPHVLIILFGLHRFYRHGWAHLQNSLIHRNPDVSFELALLTWPEFVCTNRDRKNGECGWQEGWLHCAGPLPSTVNFTREMEKFYAPIPLVYTQFTHWGLGPYERPHSINRLARGWTALLSLGLVQKYKHVIALRPDGILTHPLQIETVCAHAPELSLIFPDVGFENLHLAAKRNDALTTCADVAKSTWDFGLLACDPRALNRWLYPVWKFRSEGERLCMQGTATGAKDFTTYALSCTAAQKSTSTGNSATTIDSANACPVFRLFARKDTNAQRFRLGSLNRSHVFIQMLGNRSDQGYIRKTRPVCDPHGNLTLRELVSHEVTQTQHQASLGDPGHRGRRSPTGE
jgi:hypothetical protein